jgi:hypothetical protein
MVLLNPLSPITSDREAQRLARSQSEYCDIYKKELRKNSGTHRLCQWI